MRSWCFDSVATEVDGVTTYDREYGSAEFREVMRKLVGDGVYADPANNMQVTVGGGLSVSVLPGYCWIHGALGIVDEAESLAIDATTKGRTDLIVARFDLSLAARDIHLAVVKGAEGSAESPALTRNDSVYDICLAKVRVNAGATTVALSGITDTRYDANLCGIVTGVIDQIDATDLFAQYGDVFNDFMQQLESVLSGDVAGNLLTLINNHKNDKNNPHNVTAAQIGLGNVVNAASSFLIDVRSKNDPVFGSERVVEFDFPVVAIGTATSSPSLGYVDEINNSPVFVSPGGDFGAFYYLTQEDKNNGTFINGGSVSLSSDGRRLTIKAPVASGNFRTSLLFVPVVVL